MATSKNMIKDGTGRLVEVVDSTAREMILKINSKINGTSTASDSNVTQVVYKTETKSYDADISKLQSQISQLQNNPVTADITIDDTPTEGSENAVSSGGVYDVLHSDVISASGTAPAVCSNDTDVWTDTVPEGRWIFSLKAYFPCVADDSAYQRKLYFGVDSGVSIVSQTPACTNVPTTVSGTALVESDGQDFKFGIAWNDPTNTDDRDVAWRVTGFKIPSA